MTQPLLDRTQAPPARDIEHIHIAQATSQTLKNGLPLHVLRVGVQPVVELELIFRAGAWYAPQPGTTQLTARLLTEGTRRRSGNQIADQIADRGAFLTAQANDDYLFLTLNCLSRHLPALAPLLVEIVNEAAYPEAELEEQRRNLREQLRVAQQKTSYQAQVRFREKMYPDGHPYGYSLRESDLDALTTDQLRAFHTRYLHVGHADALLAGQWAEADLQTVCQILEQLRANANGQPAPTYPLPQLQPTADTVEIAGSLQSSLRLGRLLVARAHPDYCGLRVLNTVLGGYFGSRLMRNIREEKGLTYGIYSQLNNKAQGAEWVIGADVRREATAEALHEIRHEMSRLCESLVPEDELGVVRSYMLGTLANNVATPFELAEKFKVAYLSGLGYGYYDQLVATIRTITPEKLRTLAQRYLQPAQWLEVVAGGR